MGWSGLAKTARSVAFGVFGQPVTYRSSLGEYTGVRGYFREASRSVTFNDGPGVNSTSPTIKLSLDDIGGAVARDDEVELEDGRLFRVVTPLPDGRGGVALRLQRKAAP